MYGEDGELSGVCPQANPPIPLTRGNGFKEIVRFLHLARQVGLVQFWAHCDWWRVVDDYWRLEGSAEKDLWEKDVVKLNEKIVQLFEILSGGLVISAGGFVWEILKGFYRRRRNSLVENFWIIKGRT